MFSVGCLQCFSAFSSPSVSFVLCPAPFLQVSSIIIIVTSSFLFEAQWCKCYISKTFNTMINVRNSMIKGHLAIKKKEENIENESIMEHCQNRSKREAFRQKWGVLFSCSLRGQGLTARHSYNHCSSPVEKYPGPQNMPPQSPLPPKMRGRIFVIWTEV